MKYALNFEPEALGNYSEFDEFEEEATDSFWELDEYPDHECESCAEFDPEFDETEWEAEIIRGRRAPQRQVRTRPGMRRSRLRPRVIRRPGQVIADPSICTCPAPNCPRHGSEYVRWVQSALNQIMNLRLSVTGIMNAPTRSALRSFQEKQGLPVDGIAGPETKEALIAAKGGKLPGGDTTKPAEPAGSTEPTATPSEPVNAKPAAEFDMEDMELWKMPFDRESGHCPHCGLTLGEAEFGNKPRSFALRVRIVGYASPRWRGAKSATEADRLNFQLSSKRAETVHALVEKELRARLGPSIKIDYAVSQLEPQTPQGIEIGSYGAGSIDALAAAGGNRKDNSEINRKVEVMIEKITTTYTTGGVSLPPQRLPGKTDSWALGVTKLRMLAAGLALGSIEIVLRNRLTGKQMFATADLYGGGIGGGVAKAGANLKKQVANALKNNLKQAAGDFIGRGEVFFTTKDKMGFDDFNGQFIRIGKALAALGIKAVYSYATFTPFIGHHPKMLAFQKKITAGWPDLEGWVVSGKLQLRGTNPGDWWEYDRSGQVHSSYDKSWQETLLLTYPTGKWELLPADKSRLTDFVATWARRYL